MVGTGGRGGGGGGRNIARIMQPVPCLIAPYIYDARHHAHPYTVSTTVLSDISYAFLSC